MHFSHNRKWTRTTLPQQSIWTSPIYRTRWVVTTKAEAYNSHEHLRNDHKICPYTQLITHLLCLQDQPTTQVPQKARVQIKKRCNFVICTDVSVVVFSDNLQETVCWTNSKRSDPRYPQEETDQDWLVHTQIRDAQTATTLYPEGIVTVLVNGSNSRWCQITAKSPAAQSGSLSELSTRYLISQLRNTWRPSY